MEKKLYIKPELNVEDGELSTMLALSIKGGVADDSDALTKDVTWDIWTDEDDDYEDE